MPPVSSTNRNNFLSYIRQFTPAVLAVAGAAGVAACIKLHVKMFYTVAGVTLIAAALWIVLEVARRCFEYIMANVDARVRARLAEELRTVSGQLREHGVGELLEALVGGGLSESIRDRASWRLHTEWVAIRWAPVGLFGVISWVAASSAAYFLHVPSSYAFAFAVLVAGFAWRDISQQRRQQYLECLVQELEKSMKKHVTKEIGGVSEELRQLRRATSVEDLRCDLFREMRYLSESIDELRKSSVPLETVEVAIEDGDEV